MNTNLTSINIKQKEEDCRGSPTFLMEMNPRTVKQKE